MSHAHASLFAAYRRGAAALVACLAALLTLQVVQAPAAAAATPSMYQGPAFPNVTGTAPTEDKPQSKLWYAHGSWWADMFDTTSGDWHIFRLDRGTQQWIDTGVPIDDRPDTLADVLWDGTHLYVASHVVTVSEPFHPMSNRRGRPPICASS